MYDCAPVEALVKPYQDALIGLYYSFVHPSLPILEDRANLEAAIASGSIPASLLAAIYYAAIRFWKLSPELEGVEPISNKPLYDFIFTTVTLEARTPSLRTVQAMLVYLHSPPYIVREPNHPGFWALTSQVQPPLSLAWLLGNFCMSSLD